MFLTSLSFYHLFITGVLHGGSTWWFIKDSFHSSIVLQDFSQSYDPSSLLQNEHGVQHMFCLRSSSILHLAFRSAILSTLSLEMVLCHSWQFLLVFHDSQVVRNEIIKSIIFCFVQEIFSTNQSFCWSYIGL